MHELEFQWVAAQATNLDEETGSMISNKLNELDYDFNHDDEIPANLASASSGMCNSHPRMCTCAYLAASSYSFVVLTNYMFILKNESGFALSVSRSPLQILQSRIIVL